MGQSSDCPSAKTIYTTPSTVSDVKFIAGRKYVYLGPRYVKWLGTILSASFVSGHHCRHMTMKIKRLVLFHRWLTLYPHRDVTRWTLGRHWPLKKLFTSLCTPETKESSNISINGPHKGLRLIIKITFPCNYVIMSKLDIGPLWTLVLERSLEASWVISFLRNWLVDFMGERGKRIEVVKYHITSLVKYSMFKCWLNLTLQSRDVAVWTLKSKWHQA